jgi:hypothetical protein
MLLMDNAGPLTFCAFHIAPIEISSCLCPPLVAVFHVGTVAVSPRTPWAEISQIPQLAQSQSLPACKLFLHSFSNLFSLPARLGALF